METKETYNFGEALEWVKKGYRITRKGWKGELRWVKLQKPDENSKMTLPYLYVEYPEGVTSNSEESRVPWTPSQSDMLSNDWTVVI